MKLPLCTPAAWGFPVELSLYHAIEPRSTGRNDQSIPTRWVGKRLRQEKSEGLGAVGQ